MSILGDRTASTHNCTLHRGKQGCKIVHDELTETLTVPRVCRAQTQAVELEVHSVARAGMGLSHPIFGTRALKEN